MLFDRIHGHPLLQKVIYGVAIVIGVVGYARMPRNMYPDVERPQVVVTTQLAGASAQTITQKISRPIEQELHGLRQVRDVQSLNKNEVSMVRAEFEYDKGLESALLDVNNALSRVRARLPADASSFSVQPVGAFTKPVMVVALSPKPGSALSLSKLRLLAENDIKAAFVTRPGIANVEVFGGHEPIVRVEIDPFRLARYKLSFAQVQESLAKTNQDWPAGAFLGERNSMVLTIPGERGDVGRLRNVRLTGDVTLGDVADVKLGHADQVSAYHGNGRQGIAVAILRAPGGAVETALDSAEQSLQALKTQFPLVDFELSETQRDLIDASSAGMVRALADAVVFTGLVMLLFLGNWRAVIVALLCLPLVFLLTVAVLWVAGKDMNILVMTGVILALGMLVDDAVVVLENIERHIRLDASAINEAVWRATREVLSPLFIGSMATVAVITPLMFVGDLPEQLFKQLVLTVIIAVVLSYFVSVTVIPRICVHWCRNGLPQPNRIERWLQGLYARWVNPGAGLYVRSLNWGLSGAAYRRVVLIGAPFVVLVLSMKTIVPLIGRDAMPPMDTGDVRLHVRFGSGESVKVAQARLSKLESQLMQDPRVRRVSMVFGSEPGVMSMGAGQLPAEATVNISYVSRFERKQGSHELERELRQALQDLPNVMVANAFDAGATALSSVKAPVDLRLSADDWRLLPTAAQAVQEAVRKVGGVTSVSGTWDGFGQEMSLRLDENKLRALGLTPAAVYAQLPFKAPQVSGFNRLTSASSLPVRAYLTEPFHSNPHALALLPIPLPNGESIPLGELGQMVRQPGTAMLTTSKLRYTLDVMAYRDSRAISLLSDTAMTAANDVLPPGVTLEDKGDNEAGTQATKRMAIGLAAGIVLLFCVLAPAYGSVPLALLSLLILPLSVIGAVWALLAFDKALGMPALLGIVLLCSIVIKNSILMVDFIRHRGSQATSAAEAAADAIRLRYRPILMTAFCTIAGMLPIALQSAVGLERMSPLAVVAIGGLLLGTVLSMTYLPLFYAWRAAKPPVATLHAKPLDLVEPAAA